MRFVRHLCQERVLECVILTGAMKGQTLFVPRIPITMDESYWPWPWIRKQFPVQLAFAMTINKAQGQTLQRCGLRTAYCRRVQHPEEERLSLNRVRTARETSLSPSSHSDGTSVCGMRNISNQRVPPKCSFLGAPPKCSFHGSVHPGRAVPPLSVLDAPHTLN